MQVVRKRKWLAQDPVAKIAYVLVRRQNLQLIRRKHIRRFFAHHIIFEGVLGDEPYLDLCWVERQGSNNPSLNFGDRLLHIAYPAMWPISRASEAWIDYIGKRRGNPDTVKVCLRHPLAQHRHWRQMQAHQRGKRKRAGCGILSPPPRPKRWRAEDNVGSKRPKLFHAGRIVEIELHRFEAWEISV